MSLKAFEGWYDNLSTPPESYTQKGIAIAAWEKQQADIKELAKACGNAGRVLRAFYEEEGIDGNQPQVLKLESLADKHSEHTQPKTVLHKRNNGESISVALLAESDLK